MKDGCFRCPNSQQGFSGFTTWTRGLAWAICGFAEEIEFLDSLKPEDFPASFSQQKLVEEMLEALTAVADYYIAQSAEDGIPYWDTGAPDLARLGDYLNEPANPFNDFEPVDSSAACIAAQGLLRLGHYLKGKNQNEGQRFWQAGLTLANTLLQAPYLSMDPGHQGLILHSIYHRPKGWDHIPTGKKIPCGESSMWGDYHVRELMLYLQKNLNHQPYHTFFNL